ncbi:hypothetical protein SKAU_G00136450 [Synaphobranchus kaupii]|uniref:Uncharacterized protein n=1 Tax=Synaphobranchus kaupii TaxID=118154 RepID=A0A9Q1FRT2_SYNKA|nr:hypothetical protein SKAU_G00136450 [Synaphobranchus kaupii]
MLDTGSMATTVSADAVPCLREAGVVTGEFLSPADIVLVGCGALVEPSTFRCVGRNILVGRVVTPLWGDGWLPIKNVNPTTAEVTLRRNSKVADIDPCITLEDFDDNTDTDQTVYQNVGRIGTGSSHGNLTAKTDFGRNHE